MMLRIIYIRRRLAKHYKVFKFLKMIENLKDIHFEKKIKK